MNQDIEHPAPEAVMRVREAVREADGLWLFSPEYNHAIPGPLKNLIDWLSRPVSEAEGQVSRFNDMYDEYAKYPLITKKRMFYEMMEEVLPGLKVIVDGSDGTQTVLPLDSFVDGNAKGGAE